MSRIGKNPISIPAGVELSIDGNVVTVKGKLGELSQEISGDITVRIEGDTVILNRPSESKPHVTK